MSTHLLALQQTDAVAAVERTAASARSTAREEDDRADGLEAWSRGLRRQAERARATARRNHDEGTQLVALGQRALVDGTHGMLNGGRADALMAAGRQLKLQGQRVQDEGRRLVAQARREDERAEDLDRTAQELEREAGRARRRAAGLRMRAELAERRGTLTYRLRRPARRSFIRPPADNPFLLRSGATAEA